MKIDINKKYRTRDGREVKLFTTESRILSMPVTGEARAQAGPWQSFGWNGDGLSFTARGNPYPQLDLIEVRQPREGWIPNYSLYETESAAMAAASTREAIRVREILD